MDGISHRNIVEETSRFEVNIFIHANFAFKERTFLQNKGGENRRRKVGKNCRKNPTVFPTEEKNLPQNRVVSQGTNNFVSFSEKSGCLS